MNELQQGSIVLVDFTYADQKQFKLRPALVISNSGNNRMSRDVIVMKTDMMLACHKHTAA